MPDTFDLRLFGRNLIKFSLLYFFLFLYIPAVHAQQAPAHGLVQIQNFKGAELFVNQAGRGKVTLCLKVYYSCQSNVPATEYVSLFESLGNRLVEVFELKRDTAMNAVHQPAVPCAGERDNCFKSVIYSAAKDLGIAHMDYDLTWGYCCFDRNVVNLHHQNKQGIALSLHLTNPATAEPNHMSSLVNLPVYSQCSNTSTFYNLVVHNPDSDATSYALMHPSHFNVSNQPKYNYVNDQARVTPDQAMSAPVFNGSLLTNHPPFEPVQYAQGFTAQHPFLKGDFRLDSQTGKIDVTAINPGKYLIGINIQEKRNNKMIAEHAAVFIIEIH